MQSPVSVFCTFAAGEDGLVFVELAFLDGHVNTDDVLPDDASGADVQVSMVLMLDILCTALRCDIL